MFVALVYERVTDLSVRSHLLAFSTTNVALTSKNNGLKGAAVMEGWGHHYIADFTVTASGSAHYLAGDVNGLSYYLTAIFRRRRRQSNDRQTQADPNPSHIIILPCEAYR
jgi:hypothetical protein